MGQTLTHGVYLPNEGERNCYNGLASNWRLLDGAIGTVAAHTTAIAGKADISHAHGNISNDGKVGTTANVPLITGTGGVVQAGSFGTSANTFCEGNDSRLSDARTPVAHTHTKSDITNLFNSANSWTENNTYAKYILMKNNTVEVGNAPSNNTSKEITFTDKNNETLSRLVGKAEASGNSYIFLHATNKYTNNALAPNGSARHSYFYVGLDATGKAYNKHAADTFPDVNNTYDLGSSSYQWNNLYAKNYYYNGVAWGLDKANVWSAENTYNTINLKYYLSGQHADLYWKDENDTTISAFRHNAQSITLGTRYTGKTAWYQGAQIAINQNGTIELRSYDGTNNHSIVLNSQSLYPVTTDDINLGTTNNKWKTFNGVNPGALSLPDMSSGTGVSLSAGSNSYSPPSSGWLSINLTGAISVVCGNFCHSGTDMLSVPVVKGSTYTVTVATSGTAYLFVSQGNV